jgi:hypothetical protein
MTIRVDDPVTREWLRQRAQLEWGAIMLIAHGYSPESPFPPKDMSPEFKLRHKLVKDDIDDGVLKPVKEHYQASISTKIKLTELHKYAKEKSAIDPQNFRWLLDFCTTWLNMRSEMPGTAKRSRTRQRNADGERAIKQQYEEFRREAEKLDPRLSIAKRAKILSDMACLGRPPISTAKKQLSNQYGPWIRRNLLVKTGGQTR